MTRTNKWNTDHSHLHRDVEPKYFSKSGGHLDQDPSKVKKNGHGKGNWGSLGDEINDIVDSEEGLGSLNKRRGSNHSFNEEKIRNIQSYKGPGAVLVDEDEETE
ncbi:Ribosome associating protein [Komagataella phaffii CBS 7435]|uniref:Hyaluronan/mRNA-binding protein domain-containing protein n=2 Tax=Komagataella phaffii TaxID=460519 RepID=C4R7T1_KOMPG|nr:uncharacterized protein PAS_chr4_0407 [Komagataella phaffii GS115]AOA65173.1 GQ67_04758T0 [Komagataella phaffii]KAI0463096.1 hypothetical protein LJB42_003113 [Komagataella kurtzmanii]CAH2450960.1 Ribosome associating protein [Komagataella phaffii CBS 7435]AOA69626.1 GQ68_04730T0 [Komagataella phaffii GS115]CAY71656.1 Protein of unknown function that associates with ribosomes [Komagataella phaffii GS115]